MSMVNFIFSKKMRSKPSHHLTYPNIRILIFLLLKFWSAGAALAEQSLSVWLLIPAKDFLSFFPPLFASLLSSCDKFANCVHWYYLSTSQRWTNSSSAPQRCTGTVHMSLSKFVPGNIFKGKCFLSYKIRYDDPPTSEICSLLIFAPLHFARMPLGLGISGGGGGDASRDISPPPNISRFSPILVRAWGHEEEGRPKTKHFREGLFCRT